MTPTTPSILDQPLKLPCGVVLKNRLAKSAMSDSLGDGTGNPTPEQINLYGKWARGGTALAVIGEVQVDPRFPEKPGNLVLGGQSDRDRLACLAKTVAGSGSLLWPQLGHAGALAHPPISKPTGPSPLQIGDFHCDGLTLSDVQNLPFQFADAALMAKSCGFGGVQIHAGHGFLLGQFLSPLFNRRTDDYGGSIGNRCRIILEIVQKVRQAVTSDFPIGIKINSSDQLEGGLTEEEALDAIRLLKDSSIDLIDVSGGTYFPGAKASSDSAGSGPYFVDFAKRARARTSIPLMVTGGFKTRGQAVEALSDGKADIVGIARGMVLDPCLPDTWLHQEDLGPTFPRFKENPPPGGVTAWYTMRLTAIGENTEATFNMDLETAIQDYDKRDDERCKTWNRAFN